MGTLFIVSTPIGNLKDITIRAIETLLSVDVIASEDTRVTGQLIHHLEEKYSKIFSCPRNSEQRLIRFDQVIEPKIVPEIIDSLEKGKNIALVTDAGTPLISDPGHLLVTHAISCAIPVIAIPGPSAFLTALTVSGRPVDRFSYFGFVPEKENAVKGFLTSMRDALTFTKISVCYVSPHRLPETLKLLADIDATLEVIIARELTKIHEEVFRGTVAEALTHFSDPKGEFVLMIRQSSSRR